MPGTTVPRTTQNSQRGRNGDSESKAEEDAELSPIQMSRRLISGAKTFAVNKAIDAVKNSALDTIHDPEEAGRPIWRQIREAVFKTLNQVGGGLGDYIIQEAIDDKNTMKVIDGFGGPIGYDLDKIDTAGIGDLFEKGYMELYAQTWNREAFCYPRYERLTR
jgi:hypothetical protein